MILDEIKAIAQFVAVLHYVHTFFLKQQTTICACGLPGSYASSLKGMFFFVPVLS